MAQAKTNKRSYNKINGTWACESDGVMNKLIKDEMGHRGYIMSDWNGRSFDFLPPEFLLIGMQPNIPRLEAQMGA